jgi:hypothetical protein
VTQFCLRKTWPDNDDIFHVVNADGDTIARVSHDGHGPSWQDRWRWFMSAYQYGHRPDFEGRCATREEASRTAIWHLQSPAMAERLPRRRRAQNRELTFISLATSAELRGDGSRQRA